MKGCAGGRSAAGAATVAVKCMQATDASKLALWKAIMVGLQPILLDRLQWKLLIKVGGSCLFCLCTGDIVEQDNLLHEMSCWKFWPNDRCDVARACDNAD